MMERIDLSFLRKNNTLAKPVESEVKDIKPKQKRSTVLKRNDRNIYRRAFSETQLLDLLEREEFVNGTSYHFITGGDVDSLSYLKAILRKQELSYCLLSTWCMAAEDIYQIQEWLDSKRIIKLDVYVGEIFPNTYRLEYALLKKIIIPEIGRIAIFRNHAKIYAGIGEKFAFGIETSANVNTNPRTENGCITIGPEIYKFYKDYLDGIISFEKGT
jgi:hypothetical protein